MISDYNITVSCVKVFANRKKIMDDIELNDPMRL